MIPLKRSPVPCQLRPLRSDQNQSQNIESYFNCCYKCFDSFFFTHLPPLTTGISRAKLFFFQNYILQIKAFIAMIKMTHDLALMSSSEFD